MAKAKKPNTPTSPAKQRAELRLSPELLERFRPKPPMDYTRIDRAIAHASGITAPSAAEQARLTKIVEAGMAKAAKMAKAQVEVMEEIVRAEAAKAAKTEKAVEEIVKASIEAREKADVAKAAEIEKAGKKQRKKRKSEQVDLAQQLISKFLTGGVAGTNPAGVLWKLTHGSDRTAVKAYLDGLGKVMPSLSSFVRALAPANRAATPVRYFR